MNTFFGYKVVEKLKIISFDYENNISSGINKNLNVTNNKYHEKIESVKNEKIKKSLIELTKVFREK